MKENKDRPLFQQITVKKKRNAFWKNTFLGKHGALTAVKV